MNKIDGRTLCRCGRCQYVFCYAQTIPSVDLKLVNNEWKSIPVSLCPSCGMNTVEPMEIGKEEYDRADVG